jgi:alkylated DNA nucleotide flippase Atl1
MTNRYTRALRQLKSKSIDEKLQLLSEIPTNSSGGLYVDVPGIYTIPPITSPTGDAGDPVNLGKDGDGEEGYSGDDTTGLFKEDGTVLTVIPPGDNSYILGPMISMWYAWANYTQIGYVRQSDRKMVNLGRITGELDDWDGETGFTSYGQLSLEQAVWYQGQTRQDYRAFYPGPPSNPADEYGRYLGSIVSESRFPDTRNQPKVTLTPGTQRGFSATDDHALAMDRGGAAVGIGIVIWMGIEGAKVIKNLIDSLTPEQRERLFDNNTSQFGDTDAAGRAAETNIGYEMAQNWPSIRNPVPSPPPVRRYDDPGSDYLPGNMRPYMGPRPGGSRYQMASYRLKGNLLREQASGGGTITAHTDAGDVTITIPSTPPMPPEDKGGMRTTPESGIPTDYSKQQLNWLKGQESEYFVSGYVKGTAARPDGAAELEKMFAGTTVSWYQVVRMSNEINETEKARTEANERALEIWDEVSPQIDSQLARIAAIPKVYKDGKEYVTSENFYNIALPAFNEIDRLFALHDEQTQLCVRLAEQYLEMSGRLGRYVQSGKLVDPDPFNLNDPTIKKEKELDEAEINKLIAELRKAASDAQRAALLNKLKAFGYGALLAAGAVLGFKILLGGAGLKALGAPIVNMLKKLAPKVTKTPVSKPPVPKPSGKPFQNASDDFIRAITDPKNYTRANDAVSKAPKGFKNDVGIQINIGGKTQTVNAADILRFKGFQVNSHQLSGKLLTESQKRILRDIKKPVQVKEMPTKFKVKPTGRKNKTVGADMMKIPDTPNQYKPPAPNIWASKDRQANIRASQEKKNEVLELVGAAEHHWTYLTEESRRKKQEKVNEMMSAEYDKQMELLYEKHRMKEAKITKAMSAFRKPTDVAPEYPKDPPPQLDPETGMHPKYGKKYKHDKLDPHSAEAMPPTGDPVIDANVKKATNAKEKARKLKVLMGKTKRG